MTTHPFSGPNAYADPVGKDAADPYRGPAPFGKGPPLPLRHDREHYPEGVLEILDRLVALEQGRQAQVDNGWARIPFQLHEELVVPAGSTGPLNIPPMSNVFGVVQTILCVVPSGTTGATLVLGRTTIPLPFAAAVPVVFNPIGLRIPVTPGDARTITFAPATGAATYIALFGELLPQAGTVH